MSLKNKILVLGGGDFQFSGVKTLKELGFYTITLDIDRNAVAKNISDEFYVIDITSSDDVMAFISENKIENNLLSCIAFCTDAPLNVVGEVNSKFNLTGLSLDNCQLSLNKFKQREILKKNKLNFPEYQMVNNFRDIRLPFPYILKPIDSSGSRGVFFVEKKPQLKKYFNDSIRHSKSNKCIVEEFIRGKEYTVESLIINNKIFTLAISEKFKPLGNHTVSDILMYNSPKVFRDKDSIEECVNGFLEKSGYNNTIVHSEVIHSKDDSKFYLIESSVRSGGFGIFDEVLPYCTGIDIVKLAIKVYLQRKVSFSGEVKTNSYIMRFVSGQKGVLEGINQELSPYVKDYSSNYKVKFYKKRGDEIEDLNSDGARIGCIFTFHQEWLKAFELSNLIRYEIELNIV